MIYIDIWPVSIRTYQISSDSSWLKGGGLCFGIGIPSGFASISLKTLFSHLQQKTLDNFRVSIGVVLERIHLKNRNCLN